MDGQSGAVKVSNFFPSEVRGLREGKSVHAGFRQRQTVAKVRPKLGDWYQLQQYPVRGEPKHNHHP